MDVPGRHRYVSRTSFYNKKKSLQRHLTSKLDGLSHLIRRFSGTPCTQQEVFKILKILNIHRAQLIIYSILSFLFSTSLPSLNYAKEALQSGDIDIRIAWMYRWSVFTVWCDILFLEKLSNVSFKNFHYIQFPTSTQRQRDVVTTLF